MTTILLKLYENDKTYTVPTQYDECIEDVLKKYDDTDLNTFFFELVGLPMEPINGPRCVNEHLVKEMLRYGDRRNDGHGGFYIHDFNSPMTVTEEEASAVLECYASVDKYFNRAVLKKNSNYKKVLKMFVSRCNEAVHVNLYDHADFFVNVIASRQWYLLHVDHLRELMDVIEAVNSHDPKTNTKMAQALHKGFEMLLHFNRENFDVKEDGVLVLKESEHMDKDNVASTKHDGNDIMIHVQTTGENMNNVAVTSHDGNDVCTPSTPVGLKRNYEIVTPEKLQNKKGKKSFMSNLREVTASGKVTFDKNDSAEKKYEFCFNFTEPVRQQNGGHKVCLMMNGYVDKVKGNDMFIFKPHMIKKTFELLSALGGLDLNFKYAKDVIQNMRLVCSRRKFPGESNNMTVKTDKSNRYDALVLCGVFLLKCDNNANSAELKEEMMSIVSAVRGIIGHDDFHEQYKAGAYVDQVYSNAPLSNVIEDLQKFAHEGKDIDFLINDKRSEAKMAACIMEDKDNKIKAFRDMKQRVYFNVSLDCVLIDEHINRIVPKLIGIYSETYAHVLMKYPGARSRAWITADF